MGNSVATPQLLDALHVNWKSVEAGVPTSTLQEFAQKSGLELKALYDVVIPARKLRYREAHSENLSSDESDRLARFIRVFDHTVRVFGDPEKARRWLSKPKHLLEERSPLQLLRTETGAHMVEDMLWQIADGVFV